MLKQGKHKKKFIALPAVFMIAIVVAVFADFNQTQKLHSTVQMSMLTEKTVYAIIHLQV